VDQPSRPANGRGDVGRPLPPGRPTADLETVLVGQYTIPTSACHATTSSAPAELRLPRMMRSPT